MPASLDPTLRRDTKRLLYAIGIVGGTRSLLTLLKTLRRSRSKRRVADVWTDKTTYSIATFPLALRRSFALARAAYPDSLGVPVFLASPSLLLIPSEWRIHLALYAGTSALVAIDKPPGLRRVLPPIWTLNCIGNAILIMLFLTEENGVHPTYSAIVTNHSAAYMPNGKTKQDITNLLANTDYPRITREQARAMKAHPLHSRMVCATLHPDTPSCLENFLSSMLREFMNIAKWMGAAGFLAVLYKRRGRVLSKPLPALREWLSYTARSSLFASGGVNTAWGLICLLQRLLPGTSIPRLRFLANGTLASLWILVLPPGRRKGISLYVFRFAVLNAYQVVKSKTGWCLPYGEVLIFALAFTSLLRTQRSGGRVGGLASLLLKSVDV